MEFKRKVRQSIKFIQRFNFLNFYMGGFTINMSTYFLWLILPLLMKDNGGTSFQIGLADAITFGVTGITCPFIGLFLTKKWFPAGDVTRIGFILQGSCCVSIAIYFIDNGQLLPLFFLLLQESYALSFFWSICEFLISEEVYKGETNKKISYFSCSWSLGKAIGFLLGGVMRSAFGYTYSLYFAAVISLVSWVTFPRFLRNRSDTTHAEAKELKTINVRLDVHTVNDVPEADTRKPYYYMMYYVNLLIIHCTVYGTVAIFW
ncbi:Major facilitator superfamily (MFS) profile domain-containing protein [Entamoeba marina]